MEWKVCGMREEKNVQEIGNLKPNFMGFIFFKASSRFVGSDYSPKILNNQIKSIGVFVNEDIEEILSIVERAKLDGIQLHGDESPQYCEKLKEMKPDLLIFKAFRIKDESDLDILIAYEGICDRFILDSKGALYGGNGHAWNYAMLKNKTINTSFLLSGGIDENFDKNSISTIHPNCVGFDLNSKFEISPALKDAKKLKTFIEK